MACQPIVATLDGSHVDEDDLSAVTCVVTCASDLEAVCAAAHQRLVHVGCSCDDSDELAGLDGDIDMEDHAVELNTTPDTAIFLLTCIS